MRQVSPIVAALAVVMSASSMSAVRGDQNAPGPALNEDECRAIWNTAAGRADLSVDGAKPYIDSFVSVDTNSDRKISNGEFKAGCAAGLVHKFRRSE